MIAFVRLTINARPKLLGIILTANATRINRMSRSYLPNDDMVPEFDDIIVAAAMLRKQYADDLNASFMYSADPNCEHDVYSPSGGGIKCRKCPGWFCY